MGTDIQVVSLGSGQVMRIVILSVVGLRWRQGLGNGREFQCVNVRMGLGFDYWRRISVSDLKIWLRSTEAFFQRSLLLQVLRVHDVRRRTVARATKKTLDYDSLGTIQ